MSELSIVVPAYNEAENLEKLLPIWKEFCLQNNFKMVIVNDGSRDESRELLSHFQDSWLKVINHKVNRGYGGALKSGIRAVETKYCITMDGDGQHSLDDVVRLYNMMRESDYDLIVGKRPSCHDTLLRKIGKAIIRKLAQILLPDLNIHDINSGMKIYIAENTKKYLRLCPSNMAFSDVITMIHVKFRDKVTESEIAVNPRTLGESTIGVRTAFQTVWEIVILVIMFNPIRIFLPLAFLCFALGAVWTIGFLLAGDGFTVASAILIIASLIFLCLGLLAEQLSTLLTRVDQ